MLLIGTVISLVTAVAATRAMLGLLAGFRWFDNPRFMGAAGAQHARWLQIDFAAPLAALVRDLGARLLALGGGSLGVRGLNLGIDFKGGTQVTFTTPTAGADRRRARAGGADRPGRRGRPGPRHAVGGDQATSSSRSGTKHLEPQQQTALQHDLTRR